MSRFVVVALALVACKPEPVDSVDPLTVDDDGDGLSEAQGDCDDADPAFSPNAIEIPGDGIDQDCDNQEQCYRDDDKDGFHRTSTRGSADLDCDDEGESTGDGPVDCDDGRATAYPGADEVTGNEVDEDCDGREICYVDADGDDAGSTATVESTDRDCDDDGEASAAGDCDDEDPTLQGAGAEEVADGVDGDCDGKELCLADDDEDGSRSEDTVVSDDLDCEDPGEASPAAPLDCDDTDPGRDDACRPAAPCARVTAAALEALALTAFDLAYAADCSAWVPVTTGGTDGAYHVTGTGSPAFYGAPVDAQDGSAVAIDGASGVVYIGANSPAALLKVDASALVEVAAGSGTLANAEWSGITGEEPMSLAVLPDGDVLVPQLVAADTLSRVTPAGAVSTEATYDAHVAAVGLDAAGDAFVAVGAELVAVGDAVPAHTFADDVIDFVFDYNDDLYVELANGDLVYVDHHGTTQVTEDTVTGRGKLAIAPDGFLVRVRVDYPTASPFEEWDVSDR